MDEINIQIVEDNNIIVQFINNDNINIKMETPGVSKFIELEDTPPQYDEGKFLKSTSNGLVFAVPGGGGDMLVSIYDPNGNNIVDLVEGIRVVSVFPNIAKKGDMVVYNDHVYIKI